MFEEMNGSGLPDPVYQQTSASVRVVAKRLLVAGARMDEIRARMGHSSIMTTVNVYGHRSGDGGAVAEKIQGIPVQPDADLNGWLANG
jgi:hypothetical protein